MENVSGAAKIGYGIGLVAYNAGGSILLAPSRFIIALYYWGEHYHRVYCLNQELPSDTGERIGKATSLPMENLSRERFSDYSSAEEQMRFWSLQLRRATTEIFLPIIGSAYWSYKDLQPKKERNIQYPGPKCAINLGGINDLLTAFRWEHATSSVLALQKA